jgi:hypothetical protein
MQKEGCQKKENKKYGLADGKKKKEKDPVPTWLFE